MGARAKQIIAIIAIAVVLAYLGMAAVRPMENYAPMPASIVTVILATLLSGALLVFITEDAIRSIVAATLLALFLFGGIRAGVVAWNLIDLQIPFNFIDLAGADSVLQYTMNNALLMYLAAGLMGVLGAAIALFAIPDRWQGRGE